MATKLHHQYQQHHQAHPHHQHDKTDSNVASFGGTVTTTVSAAEGSGLRSVEKSAVLTEQLHSQQLSSHHLLLHSANSDAASGASTGGTGDSGSVDDDALSAASGVSSGVSTDSAEVVERRLLLQRQQLLLQQQQQLQQQLQQQQQQQQLQQQKERFASLLTVERGPATWTSHAHVTFRFRSERLYYLDSACRLHGPMDQREQCQVASVRRHVSRDGSGSQPPVATRSHHRTLHTVQTAVAPQAAAAATSSGFVSSTGGGGGLDDGILLLERRFTSSSHTQHQQPHQLPQQLPYSRVQVNRYDDLSSGAAPMPRSYSQQLDYSGYRRQRSHREHQPVQQQHQQTHHRHHQQHQQFRGRQHSNPGFDARLEHLERSLNDAMESIRRQTSTQQRQSQQHQHQQQHHGRTQPQNQQHLYITSEQQDAAEMNRRFSSEPPFEFRYSQRTMTHEPPQVTEEVETTTLQPIGRGIHDLGSGTRVIAAQVQQHQQLQQQFSLTEQQGTVGRVGRLSVRQGPAEAGARSLSANRNATLRASTPVSPKPLTVGGAGGGGSGGFSRGRHLSANTQQREFTQVY